MKITLVMGFFLPMPPAAGGATEKSWHRLAQEFVRRGHNVTIFSRCWTGWPRNEVIEGVRYVRVPGFAHRRKLWQNLALDFLWSLQILWRLPSADLVVVHAVILPTLLGWLRPSAGRLVVMPGRMPKGQFRVYRRLARILANSTPVRDRVQAENPRHAPLIRIVGCPVDATRLRPPPSREPPALVTIGYIGRIHREKGLELLTEALVLLAKRRARFHWRVLLCGPVEGSQGGSGKDYRESLAARLAHGLPTERITFADAEFDEARLIERYREIQVFCYPSIAEEGETFGVSVVEAMAAGAVPVVSALSCFRDFIEPGINGAVFDHRRTDAASLLADELARLLDNPALLASLSLRAQATARHYDFPSYAERLLADFGSLVSSDDTSSR